MRKSTTFYLLFSLTLFSISNVIKGQGGTFEVTQNGYFESVADRFGNTINYCDLSPTSSKPLGSYTNSTNSVPSISCQAGYFILYYAQGSFLESNSSFQNVICQVFTDISNFINVPAPLSNSLSSTKIHILCSDLTTSGLAVASPLFIYPQNATNPNQGYIYNQVEKALISGTNPFLNLPVAVFSGNSLYSGYLEVNPSVNWNTNLNSLGITSTQTDLYTVVLHEAIHLIGFNSMINYNGNSKLGAANNIYTRYDKYLHTASGSPLLSSTTSTSCGNSNIVYSPTTTAILGASVGTVVDDSNCATAIQYISPTNTVSVYTPTAFTSAGSFSHFEDRCTTPPTFTPASSCTAAVIPANTNNNLYYVMTNSIGLGNCFVRRFMTEEEKNVLCDLNYSVNPTYFSSALIDANSPTTTLHTYGSGCTPTLTVYGLNDGLSNSIYTFTSTTTTAVVSYSTLLVNDFPATGLQVSCLELVYNTATFT